MDIKQYITTTLQSVVNYNFIVQYVGKQNDQYKVPLFKFNLDQQIIEQLVNSFNKNDFEVSYKNNWIIINPTVTFLENLLQNIKLMQSSVKKRILVDFSSPNIAKDMHVGHLRSTIIGDSICKLYEKLGHEVLRINHIGDWGLQFGMIIEHLLSTYPDYENSNLTTHNLQELYTQSKKLFDNDLNFEQRARNKVLLLQSKDEEIVKVWNWVKDISRQSYNQIYDRLKINLSEVGESFYHDKIPSMIESLGSQLSESDGRLIYLSTKSTLPLTVIKSDGGYTYDTTDLAALQYRLQVENVNEIIYVVDSGQSLHFDLVFEAGTQWFKPHQRATYVGFGVVLGEDGKKFKSRDGNTVKLQSLLDEAVIRCIQSMEKRKVELSNKIKLSDNKKTVSKLNNIVDNVSDEEKLQIAKSIAHSAVKYFDLSNLRTNDYHFNYDKILSLDGNTGVYQQYQYVRICAILRKVPTNTQSQIKLLEIEEINLARVLSLFGEIISKLEKDLLFNSLCEYLYKLSVVFNKFFQKCRCLEYDDDNNLTFVNENRIELCKVTKYIIGECFDILGMEKLERM